LLGRGLAASLEILAKSVAPSLYSAAGTEWERHRTMQFSKNLVVLWDFNGFHGMILGFNGLISWDANGVIM
jgi:hypothetical protein